MLVLTRKPGERLRVGDVLVLAVGKVEQGKVSLVFETALPLTLMPGDVEIGAADSAPVTVTRKLDDAVLCGSGAGQLRVIIVSVKGEQVRIGVDAPRELGVYREEVWQDIRRQNEEAARAAEIDPIRLRELLGGKKKPENGDDPGEEE